LLASIGYGLLYFIGLDIIKLWVGEANVLPKDVFSVMLAFDFVHSWIHTSGMFLNAIGKHKNNDYYALGEAGLNIILSLVLIKYYGLFGVALGTVLSSLLTTAWLTPAEFFRQIKANI
jgi:O-antigen/teichoic acid export membrane protein